MPQPVKVFISYARDDSAFVDRLTEALGKRGIDSWVDRREIPPAADWLRRIVDGIVKATFFIYVVSPRSVTSEVCAVELQQAVGLNKPLVPVLWRDAEMPEALRSVQWCDFSGAESFEDCVTKLEATLRRDYEWLADHTRFAVSAADWDMRGRPWYSLLHGADIKIAEQWLIQANDTRPPPTALQTAYVHASRRFSARWKQTAAGAVMVFLIITVATIMLRQRSVREAEARDLATRAVQLRNGDQAALPVSTLMLVEAVRELSDVGVRSPDIEAMLRTGTSMLLRPLGEGIHPNGTGGMAVAPDGKLIATFAFGFNADVEAGWDGRTDNTVRVWDVPSNTPASVLAHESPVGAAAFTGNGRLVTGTISGSIEFWNLDEAHSGGATLVAKHDEGNVITSIAGSVSHEIAVTADNSGRVGAWDAATGTRLWRRIASSGSGRIVVALSPDGKLAASGDQDGRVQVWSVNDGNPLLLKQHASRGSITALAFSPGSNQIASGDDKGEMHVWSPTDGSDLFAVLHRGAVTEIAYASAEAKSPFIATVSVDGSLRLIDPIAFGPWRITEFRFDYALWHLAIDPNGHLAAVARGDGFVDLWGREEGRVVGRMHISSRNVATGLAFLPGDVLAVVDGGQGVQFAEVTAGRDSNIINTTENVKQLAVSGSGLLLASDFAGNGRAWDLSGTTAKPSSLQLSSFTDVAFSPTGDRVALIDEPAKMLRIVALASGSDIAHWSIPENIGAVAWGPKQEVVAVAKRDGGTWLYDPNTAREITHTATGGRLLSFSPDGSLIAIVVPNEGLRIWDWNSGTEPWMPIGTGDVITAAFSSPEVLLMASKDRVVRATRIPSSAKEVNPLQQIWAAEFCPDDKHLAVSSDGTLLAIACEDGRIRVWSGRTGVIASDLLYLGKPEALALTSEGRLLIVGGNNGLRSFLVSGDDLVAEACLRLQRNFSQAEWVRYVGAGRCRPICPGRPGCD